MPPGLSLGSDSGPFTMGVYVYTHVYVCAGWTLYLLHPPTPLFLKYLTQDFRLFRCLSHQSAGMGIAASYCLEVGMCPWAVYRSVLDWEVPCIQGRELGTLTRAEVSCIGAIGTILSVHSHVQNCSLLLLQGLCVCPRARRVPGQLFQTHGCYFEANKKEMLLSN